MSPQSARFRLFLSLYNAAMRLLAIAWKWRARWRKERSSLDRLRSPCSCASLRTFAALEGPTVWFHAASLGEARAAKELIIRLKGQYPEVKLALSTLTKTGHAEFVALANEHSRCLPLYLPIDLPELLLPILTPLSPKLVIAVEGDLWLNFLRICSEFGAFIAVASGKISYRSFRRLYPLRFLLSAYWNRVDLICAQSHQHVERLRNLGAPNAKLQIAGNLKLDRALPPSDEIWEQRLKRQMSWTSGDVAISLGSTHPNEELALISALWPLLQRRKHCQLLIAPRHPERCDDLAIELRRRFGDVTRWSSAAPTAGTKHRPRLHLIDVIGPLSEAYRISELAIVGGSFFPGVGGHNIFEPILAGTPPLFGPHMAHQLELVDLAVGQGAGRQVTLEELPLVVESLLDDHNSLEALRNGCDSAVEVSGGSLSATWNALKRAGAFTAL